MKNRMKFRMIGCAVLTAVSLMLGGCAMGGADGAKTVQGVQALEAGEYRQAKQFFEDAVREGEEQMLACRGLGMAYMGLAQYEEAGKAFEAALEYADDRQPENVQDLKLYLAAVQYRMADYEDTILTCSEILEAAPEGNAQAYFMRGASSLREGAQEDAKADFDAAAALAPEDYELHLNIYECYCDMNLSGIGGEYLQEALNIPGEELEHYYNRGRIYYYLENYEKAQQELIGPVESKYEPAMHLIGRVYLAQDDTDHARSIYEQMAQEFGESADSLNGLAMCAMKTGDYDTALSYIAKGLAVDGEADKQELYFNEIVVYEQKNDFASARAKAQEYIERYPADEAGRREWTFLSTR